MQLRHAALAAALALAPAAFATGTAEAATVVYQSSGAVLYDDASAPDVFADFTGTGIDPNVSVTGALQGGVASGALFVSGAAGAILESTDLVSYALGTGAAGQRTLTVVFTMLGGSGAGLFGGEDGLATAIFTYGPGNFEAGFPDPVDVAILSDVAPVPLPASLPLLLLGLGAVAALRRGRG